MKGKGGGAGWRWGCFSALLRNVDFGSWASSRTSIVVLLRVWHEQMYIFEKPLQVWKMHLRDVMGGKRVFTVSRRKEMKH